MTADDNINQLIKELETHLTDKKAHFFLSKVYRETRYRNRNQGTLTDKLQPSLQPNPIKQHHDKQNKDQQQKRQERKTCQILNAKSVLVALIISSKYHKTFQSLIIVVRTSEKKICCFDHFINTSQDFSIVNNSGKNI